MQKIRPRPHEIFRRPGALGPELRHRARVYGFRFYASRAACRNGHSPAVRDVRHGECIQCRRDQRRRWQERNKDKVLARLDDLLAQLGRSRDSSD